MFQNTKLGEGRQVTFDSRLNGGDACTEEEEDNDDDQEELEEIEMSGYYLNFEDTFIQ